MSAQNASLILLWLACPPATLFVFVYGFLQPWRKTWEGRALFVSQLALAGLLDINLVFRLTSWPLLAREGWARDAAYLLITAGVYLIWAAFARVLAAAFRRVRR